ALSAQLDRMRAVAVDPAGRVVGAGVARATADAGDDFAIVRLLADGSPDPTFGGGDGIVVLPLSSFEDTVLALPLQPDGPILAGGRLSAGHGDDAGARRLETA